MSSNIHKSAIIDPSATIGTNVKIGPYSYIGPNSIIQDNCIIHSHVSIENNVQLKNNVSIYPFTHIYWGTVIDENCIIESHCEIGSNGYGYAQDQNYHHHSIPQMGNVYIGANSKIEAHSMIDRAAFKQTNLGANSILGAFSHLAHNVQIGENANIGINFVVAGSTIIGNNFSTSARCSSVGHINITNDVRLEKRALANNTIKDAGIYAWHPLMENESYNEFIKSFDGIGSELSAFLGDKNES